MSGHVRRLIDPTPDAVVAALDEVSRAAGGTPLQDALPSASAEGVCLIGLRGFGPGRPTLALCWWPDPVGRVHLYVEAGSPEELSAFGPRFPDPQRALTLADRHPLEWIAPPYCCGWREKGGRSEFVLICRCGVVGPPRSLGWMARTCGPCHDREQDGAPLPPSVLRTYLGPRCDVAITPSSELILWRGDRHHDRVRSLSVWDDPWDEPRWVRSGDGPSSELAVSPDGRLIAFDDGQGNLVTAALADGRVLGRASSGPVRSLAFSADGGHLLTLDAEDAAWAWPCSADSAVGQGVRSSLRPTERSGVARTPDGRYLVWVATPVGGPAALVLADAATRAEVARFQPSRPILDRVAVAPNGFLLVRTPTEYAAWPWRELFGVG